MSGSPDRDLASVIEELKYWRGVGQKLLRDQTLDLARILEADDSVRRRGTWSIEGKIDLSTFRREAVNWAIKTVIKKTLEEKNSQGEINVRFTTAKGDPTVHVYNLVTGAGFYSGPMGLLYSSDRDLNHELMRYRFDQKLDAVQNLLVVVKDTFVPAGEAVTRRSA